MVDAREDGTFLLRSGHRVEVLKRLAGSPRHRHELHDEVGVPQSTLGRLLGDFESRGWVSRDGTKYELTWLGRLLTEELNVFLETLCLIRRLQEITNGLPTAEMDFDPHHFRGATVTTASRDDIGGVFKRILGQLRTAKTLRIITSMEAATTLETHWEAVVQGDQRLEAIFTDDVLNGIRADPDQSRRLDEILKSGRADVYRFEGESPYVMGIRDRREVSICAVDERGYPIGLIETDDETVRSWVADTIEDYRRRATPL